MTMIEIHRLEAPGFRVQSHGNGWAYAIHFGDATKGEPSRTVWVQDEAATELRERVEALEDENPDTRYDEIYSVALDAMGRLD